jgi:uncharacterized membrane protein
MVEFGPIQMIAIGFPDPQKLKGDMLKELFALSEQKVIRLTGLLAVVKDANGKIDSVQITELSDDDRKRLGAAAGALIGLGAARGKGAVAGAKAGAAAMSKEFGLNQSQIREVARNIPNGTAAGFLLIEHLWAKKLKEIALAQDGVVLANGFITPDSLIALGAELAEGIKAAEKLTPA